MTSLPATDIYNLKINRQVSQQLPFHLYTANSHASCFQSAALTFGQLIGQPVQAIVQTRALSGTGALGVHLWANRETGDTRTRTHNKVLKV